ncbi:ubiquitin carboxyl-terminal hydrolase 34-like, partial [Pollicipes pollicipes]|uniref:ubiquitin carboxyl-terminal hydrolase 34-like n=1 Tax=Pollicipes pollicipes TaxID=41117 RepID=UPI001884A98F
MESVCEVCSAIKSLNESYNEKLSTKNFPTTKPCISSTDVATINNFINNLNHRACNCCFQELKQYGHLNNVIQGLLHTYIEQVKLMPSRSWEGEPESERWPLEQVERMLHLVVKVFQPQFPPYLAYKHVLQRPEPSAQEPAVSFSAYCDVHDPEVSEFILRNVCYFCES